MNAQPGLSDKKVKIKKMYVYIHDILVLLCQFTSS